MGDDCCSASELRRRYEMGGDLRDDDLTAPQLRARYGIKKNAAGEEALESLEELEMIFGGVSELGGLERCTRLRTLTLIDCGLRRISNLEPVRQSLVKLCLCDQGLKKMENLHLPGLRELYLHENKIVKIEGLHGCPSLRRLWLFSNRIAAMEELHHCGDLRELLLHDNRIRAVAGLESLVHLQVPKIVQSKHLGLAGNPIEGLRHLTGLRGLPSLMELTLDDIHFGTCPVVAEDGYRDCVVSYLVQIRRLDGLEVHAAERAAAEEKYEQEALAYQERLEEIERSRLREIHQAEMARDGGLEHGMEAKAEMMRALKGLEELVKKGRDSLAAERSRHEKVQATNLQELERDLSELQRQYCHEVDKRVKAEVAKSAEEERLFAALEERTCLERDYVQLVARQQYQGPAAGLAVQELSSHSPEFEKLRTEVWASQRTQSGRVEPMNALRACRLYNRRLCEEFLAAAGENSPTIRLYLCLSGKDAEKVCCMGLTALDRPAVTLYQDPKRAAAQTDVARQGSALRGSTARVDDDNEAADEATGRDPNGFQVILQFAVVRAKDGADGADVRPSPRERKEAALEERAGGDKKYLPTQSGGSQVRQGGTGKGSRSCESAGKGGKEARHAGGDEPSGDLVGQATASERSKRVTFPDPREAVAAAGGEHGGVTQDASSFVLPARRFALALPEFHILCASGAAGGDRRALDGALAELSADNVLGPAPEADLLAQLESKMEGLVKDYLERMQQDVTPEEASNLRATDANMRRKAASLASLRAGVDDERSLQEALLSEGPARMKQS